MSDKLKRRWFQFSLRTMFISVTVFACLLAYELDWIKQRRAFIKHAILTVRPSGSIEPRAPSLLWAFGEMGYAEVGIEIEALQEKTPEEMARLDRARRLFPEADVVEVRFPAIKVRFHNVP